MKRSRHRSVNGLTGKARRNALARLLTAKKNKLGLRCDGKPLSTHWLNDPRLNGLTLKERKAEYQRLRREKNLAAGLTSEGKARKQKFWKELRGLPVEERRRRRQRFYLTQLYSAGLTSMGTPRKHTIDYFPATHFGYAPARSEIEIAWREFRSTMNIVHPAETILECV